MQLYANHTGLNIGSHVMYIDMNSYFAACEQQRNPQLRGKPVGVVAYDSANAAVIAASAEAKKKGVKTGMRLSDCKILCPDITPVVTHPAWYRCVHVDIITILRTYSEDVIARSIDEAVINFANYKLVYKDLKTIAKQIKADIKKKHDYLTCSIGIAPNTFLAKLGTELQKPDGLVEITPENIDTYLAGMQLIDLPGIASANERRLKMIGIKNPLDLRHASPALLRKAFGGVVGEYWHRRMNFGEVDFSNKNSQRNMSAGRSLSSRQTAHPQNMEAMLVALCTRLEQRMVKHKVMCQQVSFAIRYKDGTGWDTSIKIPEPAQDAMELKQYINERIDAFIKPRGLDTLFSARVQKMVVTVGLFIDSDRVIQYNLFDNRIKQNQLRKAIYEIKDKYGRNLVRKGAEIVVPNIFKDAIGFGSVKDMGLNESGIVANQYLLEEDEDDLDISTDW